MRSARRVLPILMLFALAGCSKKPADTPSNSAAQNTTAPSSDSAAGNATSPQATPTAPEPVPVPVPPQPVIVPVGTTVTVKLGEAVGSKLSSTGDSFRAKLASDIAVDGNTVIPAGASILGKVVNAQPLGKLKGGAILEIRMTSITVNGTDQSITTSSISRTEKGKADRRHGRRWHCLRRSRRRFGGRRKRRRDWCARRRWRGYSGGRIYRQQRYRSSCFVHAEL
jgi:hypothetical protein